MAKRIEEIELHSKEVQDLLGRVPSWLIRNGIIMIFLLLMVLGAGSWFFKYPDVVSAEVVVTAAINNPDSLTGFMQLKMKDATKVKIGQQVNLKFMSYPYLEFGTVKGVVSKIALVPNGDCYPAEARLPGKLVSTFGKKMDFERELKGTAEIITEEKNLLSRILRPSLGR